MLKLLAGVSALVLVAAIGFAADGTVAGAESAEYQALCQDGGVLHIQAAPSSWAVVRAERWDGTYGVVGSAQVGPTGTEAIAVPHCGPTSNGRPQYIVSVTHGDGSSTTLYAVSSMEKPLDDLWWLD